MEELKKYILLAVKNGASDVHLVSGAVPMMRVHRELKPIRKQVLKKEAVQLMVNAVLHQSQLKVLNETGDVDVGVVVANTGLRMNVHRQTNGLAMSIRLISRTIPTPEELRFEEPLINTTALEDGLVVISGPAGSGKSTTLAAIIEEMNKGRARHIITLEDPIEYRFKQGTCLIEQRQLGVDFPSFQKGLRHVLRQDPDVIVVGEMRDPETIALALTAAETGHLVLSTVHAPSASEVIERIVNVFEGAQQHQILIQLSQTLKLVVAQRLLPAAQGGLIAAREILVSTTAIRTAIQNNNLSTIISSIQTGKRYGMISMDRAIKELEKANLI